MIQTTAIIQARMGSTRLPGKVLRKILGRPMLQLQLERIRRSRTISRIIVATSIKTQDTPICRLAKQLNLPCFQGSETDVLDRYYQASLKYPARALVRLTGDCPLIDPRIIDRCVRYFHNHHYDYLTNTLVNTYPRGMDVEVFSPAVLKIAWRRATSAYDREHVTPYILSRSQKFRLHNLPAPNKLHRPELRLTVDEPADLKLARKIFQALYPSKPAFNLLDIIKFLDQNPQLKQINRQVVQKPTLLHTSPK